MSGRERGEAEASRIIAIIDGQTLGPRDQHQSLRCEAGRNGILAAKLFTAAELEHAPAGRLLADTSSEMTRDIPREESAALADPSGHEYGSADQEGHAEVPISA